MNKVNEPDENDKISIFFWCRCEKNKHLDESRKTGQILGTIMTFYSIFFLQKLTNQIY
ncbi:hypothetical protein Hanom_Chr05g00462821 [Helianthus anomalus]